MPWTKKDFPDSMKNLDDTIRDKAIEIANKLVDEGYDEERAIPISINRAKEWYENRGGSISSEITHHLVPNGDKWALESLKDSERFVFDTKAQAMEKIKEISNKKSIKVMIHDSDGKFQKIY